MSDKLYQLSELTDSRMMMESKPLPIIIWFIYTLIFLLVVALGFASFCEVDISSKARGIIRPSETVSTVTCKATGKISGILVGKNEMAAVGDVLMTIDDSELQLEKEQLKEEKVALDAAHEKISRFIEGIQSGKNPFNRALEESHYYEFEKYIDEESTKRSNREVLEEKRKQINETLSESELLLEWVSSGKKPTKAVTTSLRLKYEQYQLEFLELKNAYNEAVIQLKASKQLYETGAISQAELQKATKLKEQNLYLMNQFVMKEKKALLDALDSGQIEQQEVNSSLVANGSGVATTTLIDLQNTKDDLIKQLEILNRKIETLDLSIQQCKIITMTAGIYNPEKDYAVGDVIFSGNKLGTIIPSESETYNAEMQLSNQDIGHVKIGDVVKLKIDALPYTEYGMVQGEITSISPDATIDTTTGGNYYKVNAVLENNPLVSYKGVSKKIKVGMAFEGFVVTERKKVLRLLLEKMQLSL